jgi:hypothetical protein
VALQGGDWLPSLPSVLLARLAVGGLALLLGAVEGEGLGGLFARGLLGVLLGLFPRGGAELRLEHVAGVDREDHAGLHALDVHEHLVALGVAADGVGQGVGVLGHVFLGLLDGLLLVGELFGLRGFGRGRRRRVGLGLRVGRGRVHRLGGFGGGRLGEGLDTGVDDGFGVLRLATALVAHTEPLSAPVGRLVGDRRRAVLFVLVVADSSTSHKGFSPDLGPDLSTLERGLNTPIRTMRTGLSGSVPRSDT